MPGAGLGLFATRDFAAGDVVCTYRGKLLRTAEALKLDASDKLYLMRIGPQCYVNAAAPDSCMARFINDAGRPGAQNCWFDKQMQLPADCTGTTKSTASSQLAEPGEAEAGAAPEPSPAATFSPGALVRALRDIRSGEELFAPYGMWYWLGFKGKRGVAPIIESATEPANPATSDEAGTPAS